ncbi:MAG: ABC transporter ATP-binding protein [Hyphomicrobiales bacterium]|nr:ABC transporter ATP-binding protein [Hyphomicrobiales bacterium]
MSVLGIQNLWKSYGTGPDAKSALAEVNVDVQDGELLVLLGSSGSGKTTLLRCIAGLIEPSEGRIALGEKVFWDSATGRHLPTHQRDLGMVFQSFALWPHMSVAANVAYPLKARGWDRENIRTRVVEILRLVRCEEYADRLPATLSGGQQQRIALARALAANPAIILFDEPLSNLDALLRTELRTQIRLIHGETKFTGIYVTHDQIEAMSLGDRVAVMNDGRIEQIGTPQDIYFRPRTEFVAAFMGMSNSIDLKRLDDGWEGDAGRIPGNTLAYSTHAGERSRIRFRPESVRLVARDSLAECEAREGLVLNNVTVVDKAFHGDTAEYVIQAGKVQLMAAINANEIYQVGEQVAAVVKRDGIGLFSATTKQALS